MLRVTVCAFVLLLAGMASASSVLWTIPTNGPCTAPAVHYRANQEAIVIFSCSDGSLNAVSGSNGTTIWTAQLGGSAATDPTVTLEGHVYVAAANGLVASYVAESGAQRWTYQADHGVAQRAPLSVCDNRVFVGVNNGNVIALDATSGAKQWIDISSYVTDPSPYCADGVVVFSQYGNVMADDIVTEATAWTTDFSNPGTSYFRAPLGLGARLFYPFSGGNVYVLEGATGKYQYSLPVSTLMPLAAVRGGVVATTSSGNLVAFDGFTDTAVLRWNASQADFSSPAAPWDAQPVMDATFVGTASSLLAINTTSGKTIASVPTNTPVTRRPIADHYRPGFVYFATQESIYGACVMHSSDLGGCHA